MGAWGKRSRVRLHSGGISPGEVRLRRRGASEKATAPGRDIRDIGPDRGPRLCRVCTTPLQPGEGARCLQCVADERLVRDVRRELARLGLPPLGSKVPSGGPMSKRRALAEKALARMRKRPNAAPSPKKRTRKTAMAPKRSVSPVCSECHTVMPATRVCDMCG